MKKFVSAILTIIMAVSMISGAAVNAQAEADFEGFCIADVVRDAKDVEAGVYSRSSIPLRIGNDVCRISIKRDWQTEELVYECEMLWGRFNPNPAPITEETVKQIILGALK